MILVVKRVDAALMPSQSLRESGKLCFSGLCKGNAEYCGFRKFSFRGRSLVHSSSPLTQGARVCNSWVFVTWW